MKARYFILLPLSLCSLPLLAQVQYEELHINDVQMRVHSNGLIGTHPTSNSLYNFLVPAADGLSTLYSAGFWVGGVDADGQVRAAAHFYDLQRDLHPGPLTVTGDASITQEVSNQYNKVWKVNAADVELHTQYFQCFYDPGCNAELMYPGYATPDDFLTWPAMGDVSAEQAMYLAPFHDADGDGIYQPENGDHPCVPGDQALYLIFNDNTAGHALSGGLPLGVEVHMTSFAYDSADPAIAQTVFVHYKMINRSTQTYEDVFVGSFLNMDIGCPFDDFIGTDVGRNMLFGYNWDDIDENCLDVPGYGMQPPAFGVTILKGLLLDQQNDLDSADPMSLPAYNGTGFGDGIIGNERTGLSRSIHISREGIPATTGPSTDEHFYNYLRAIWKDGTPLTVGGFGYDPSDPDAVPTHFSYAGVTDTMGVGTGGEPQPTWMETELVISSIDRSGVASMGSITLDPGEEQDVLLAYVYARAPSGGAYASVESLKLRVDSVNAFAQTIPGIMASGPTCEGLVTSILEHSNSAVPVRIRPNPAREKVWVDLPAAGGIVRVFDAQGTLVIERRVMDATLQLDVEALAPGLYQVQVEDGARRGSGRFVKE